MFPIGIEDAAIVEPINLFQRGILYGFETPPWSAPVNGLRFETTVDRLGQGVEAPIFVKPQAG